ncbi:MAG: division/cell wall cluster transcriptional repressor MraZ [Candidatus Omnitrophica bacterium]|nr:division/cell wall cluster transcriptional repressor MraZ [Candidatus Omnitrophota bacterium]
MWYGEYSHTLDDKNRFILPSKFREKIRSFKTKKFYITRGLDGCLFLFSSDVWSKLEEKLKSLSFTREQSRAFNRLYFSGASEINIDSQGRVTIPDYLKDFANIKKEIIITGVSDRIEVWDRGVWDKFYQNNKKRFEDIAENLFDI